MTARFPSVRGQAVNMYALKFDVQLQIIRIQKNLGDVLNTEPGSENEFFVFRDRQSGRARVPQFTREFDIFTFF
jgi:hypothetical protein